MAFREAAEGVSEPLHDIRLHWINNSNNANCFSVEVNFYSRPGVVGDEDWVLLETTHDPNANYYLHSGVPALGEVCYRVQASNSLGRSGYSNRVCLEMEGYSSPAASTAVGDRADFPNETSGSSAWYVLAATLSGSAVVLGGGAFLWWRRLRPSGAGGS